MLAGYLPVTSGDLVIDGSVRGFAGPEEAAAAGISVIRGAPATVPQMSVADNLFLGIESSRGRLVNSRRVLRDAAALLDRVGLSVNPTLKLRELSPGAKRAVQLAREIARGTRLLLIDDPFVGLEPDEFSILEAALVRVADCGMTVILATQRIDVITRLASTVTVLSAGRRVARRNVDALLSDRQLVTDVSSGIRAVARGAREPLSLEGEVFRAVEWSVWHPVDPNRLIIDSASFALHRGEIVAFAGLSGSHRSELALSLFGRSYGSRTSGGLTIAGKPVTAKTPQEAIAAGLGLATDTSARYDLNLLGGIPTRVSPAALARLARLGVIDPDREYSTRGPLPGVAGLASGTVMTAAARTIETLTLWLSLLPSVVILDLPTQGASEGDASEIRALILRLAAGGTAVLLVSDSIEEILALSDRVYSLFEGRIVSESSTRETDPADIVAAVLGISAR